MLRPPAGRRAGICAGIPFAARFRDNPVMNGHTPTAPDLAPPAAGWLATLHGAALLLATALSPSAWDAAMRRAVALRICRSALRTLPWFLLLAGVLSVVVIHIVIVTASSYGLSRYALGTVVRVLVVELLPLAAALFVALREDAPHRGEAATARLAAVPGVVAGIVVVTALVAFSGAAALLFAYFALYGFTPWGVGAFTHTVGEVFGPIVLMALGLKTALFAVAVATVPAASVLAGRTAGADGALLGTVRLFVVILAIELLLLVVEFL